MSRPLLPPSTARPVVLADARIAPVPADLQDVAQSLTSGSAETPASLTPDPSTLAMIALALGLAIVSMRLLGEVGRLSLARRSR